MSGGMEAERVHTQVLVTRGEGHPTRQRCPVGTACSHSARNCCSMHSGALRASQYDAHHGLMISEKQCVVIEAFATVQ